jgi:hypothetical protein
LKSLKYIVGGILLLIPVIGIFFLIILLLKNKSVKNDTKIDFNIDGDIKDFNNGLIIEKKYEKIKGKETNINNSIILLITLVIIFTPSYVLYNFPNKTFNIPNLNEEIKIPDYKIKDQIKKTKHKLFNILKEKKIIKTDKSYDIYIELLYKKINNEYNNQKVILTKIYIKNGLNNYIQLIDEEDLKVKEINKESVKIKEINNEEIKVKEINKESVKIKEINNEEIKEKEINKESVKIKEINKEDVKVKKPKKIKEKEINCNSNKTIKEKEDEFIELKEEVLNLYKKAKEKEELITEEYLRKHLSNKCIFMNKSKTISKNYKNLKNYKFLSNISIKISTKSMGPYYEIISNESSKYYLVRGIINKKEESKIYNEVNISKRLHLKK